MRVQSVFTWVEPYNRATGNVESPLERFSEPLALESWYISISICWKTEKWLEYDTNWYLNHLFVDLLTWELADSRFCIEIQITYKIKISSWYLSWCFHVFSPVLFQTSSTWPLFDSSRFAQAYRSDSFKIRTVNNQLLYLSTLHVHACS